MTQGMVERILTRLPGTPLNAIVRAKGILLGRVPLMHHGLQRSGTNYVNACLRRIGATPINAFDPQTYQVRADGELLTCEPASVLPMAQRYFLF